MSNRQYSVRSQHYAVGSQPQHQTLNIEHETPRAALPFRDRGCGRQYSVRSQHYSPITTPWISISDRLYMSPPHNLELHEYRAINNPKGLDIISSDSIRQFLSAYGSHVKASYNEIDQAIGMPAYVLPLYLKHFTTYTIENGPEMSKPVDHSSMARDATFRNSLALLKLRRQSSYDWASKHTLEIQYIINTIGSHLGHNGKVGKEYTQRMEILSFDTLVA